MGYAILPLRGIGNSVTTTEKEGEALDKRITVGILGLAILAITSASAGAAFETHTFALLGNGSFMDSPPRFSGDIIQGTLFPGTFWIEFDDTGWPTDNTGTPENERWDYIFRRLGRTVSTLRYRRAPAGMALLHSFG